jgi:uncharacterized protein
MPLRDPRPQVFLYPPSTACPWCAELDSEWMSIEGRGTVLSYTEVHHAIQAVHAISRANVELDTQSNKPTKEEGLQ